MPSPGTPHVASRRWPRELFDEACLGVLTVLGTLLLWATVPTLLGMGSYVIVSGSMAPTLQVGDVVLADPAVEPQVGRVTTYTSPSGRTVTHRIVGQHDDGSFVTSGDANAQPDSTLLDPERVLGTARIRVPWVGHLALVARSGEPLRIAAVLAGLAGLLWRGLAAASAVVGDPDDEGTGGPDGGPTGDHDDDRDHDDDPEGGQPTAGPTPVDGGAATPGRHLAWMPDRPPPFPGGWATGLTGGSWRRAALLPVVVTLALLPAPAAATLSNTTGPVGQQLTAAGDHDSAVLADNPLNWWRFDDAPDDGSTTLTSVFTEGFGNNGTPRQDLGQGSLSREKVGRLDQWGLVKDTANDPHGGVVLMPTTVTNHVLSGWHMRPAGDQPPAGDATTYLGTEDADQDGYGVLVDHADGAVSLVRRDGGAPTVLATGAVPAAAGSGLADTWYRVELSRSQGALTATVHDGTGLVLGTVTGSDTTHLGPVDRVAVRGGYRYRTDDLEVLATVTTGANTAVDSAGGVDGTYGPDTTLGQPPLRENDGASVEMVAGYVDVPDHASINGRSYTERTVELRLSAADTGPRQVLFEQGGKDTGLNLYLDGGVLYGRVYDASWAGPLQVSAPAPPAGQAAHVTLVYGAAPGQLDLWVGTQRMATDLEPTAGTLAADTRDIGIGRYRQATQFHDGPVTGDGAGYAGRLDELALFDLALPPDRILAHATGF